MIRRKHYDSSETDGIQFQTLTDINKQEFTHHSLKFSKEMSKSSALLHDSKSKSFLHDESKSLKMMKPPKSPSLDSYTLPCQMPVKNKTLMKEKSMEIFQNGSKKSLNRNSSKTRKIIMQKSSSSKDIIYTKIAQGKSSQSTIELQLDLLRKIQNRKE
jgi:hypothetical protein